MVVGLGFLGVALITALWAVARFVSGDGTALPPVVPVAAAMLVVWIILPLTLRRSSPPLSGAPTARPSASDTSAD